MYIYGASGHGRVIIDMIDGYEKIHGVFDDNPSVKEILGYPVMGPIPAHFSFQSDMFIAIGSNQIRKTISELWGNKVRFANIIHESAIFSKRANLGSGCVIMEGAIVKVASYIGNQTIINTGASIDHDCFIEDFVHIAPQATLCGGIEVGEGTLIGANAIVLPNVKIGKWCTIGAGSIVNRDMPDHTCWIGNNKVPSLQKVNVLK